ncbi:MAG: cysteine hydrolase, partial [Desulfobacula sp.]|nr:cysteine hydrolase [Desulfobacula sp.]
VRAGFDLGYQIELASDACATRDLQFKDEIIKARNVHNSFMGALGSAFCEVKDTNEITSID